MEAVERPTMIAMRTYRQGLQLLLAACDEELLGSKHAEGKFRLDVAPGFYDGARIDDAALVDHLRSATMANLVGERAIALAIANGYIAAANVLRVEGVPHAQFLVMEA